MDTPTGTLGVTRQSSDDFEAALSGGMTFMRRLEQLGKAKDAHDESLARLNLAEDIATQHAEARKARSDADDLRAQVDKALQDANRQAAEVLRRANTEAADIRATAAKDAQDRRLRAEQALEMASRESERIRADADAALLAADRERSLAVSSRLEAERQREAHGSALARAEEREKEAKALHAKTTAGAAALRKVLDEYF